MFMRAFLRASRLCICVRTACVHVLVFVCARNHERLRPRACVCASTHINAYVCLYARTCICVNAYLRVSEIVCACARAHLYTRRVRVRVFVFVRERS